MASTDRPTVVALINDLFFSVRLTEAGQRHGFAAQVVRSAEEFLAELWARQPALAVVDLGARGVDVPAAIRAAKADPVAREVPILAFGSHMDLDARRAALDAGAGQVVANSKFVQLLSTGLASHLSSPGRT